MNHQSIKSEKMDTKSSMLPEPEYLKAKNDLLMPEDLSPESPYSVRAMETELAVQCQIDSGELDYLIWPEGKPPQA